MADAEKELDIIVKAIAQNTAALQEVTTSVDKLDASVARSAITHEKHATAGKKVAEEEHIITTESRESAKAFGELGAKGGELFERFSALTTAAGGLQGTLTGGLLLGLGAIAEGAIKVNETYQEQQNASLDLQQATKATGQSYEELNKRFEDFVSTNVDFIPNENAAKDALASFVRAGFDADTSMQALNSSLDISAIKHEDLKTASDQLLLAMEGSGKGIKDLGVNVSELTKSDENAVKAHKDYETATAAVAKRQDELATAEGRLKLIEDELSGKHKLTAAEADKLAGAQKSVTDAANGLATAEDGQKKALDDVNTSMSTSKQVLDDVKKRTDDGKKSVSDLQKQQDDLNHTWDQFAHDTGPAVEAVWEGTLGTVDGLLQLLLDIPGAAEAAWKALSAGPGQSQVVRGRTAQYQPNVPGESGPPIPAGGSTGGTVNSLAPAGVTNNFYIQAQDPASTAQAVLAAMLTAS